METKLFKNYWLTTLGLMLAMPATYFVLAALLKFELNINGPYDLIAPLLSPESWTVNIIIALGPVAAILLNIFQVLTIQFRITREDIKLSLAVRKRWFPLLVIAFAGSLLTILFLYLAAENCNCQTQNL